MEYESEPNERLFETWFEVGELKTVHRREVYTVYDLLGDLGGLFGMLQLVCQSVLFVVTSLFGDGLQKYLIESLFKHEV